MADASRQHEPETDLLERLAQYREEYGNNRLEALKAERERRRVDGEVYFAGGWMPAPDASRVARALQQRELVVFIEIALLLALSVAVALGLCWVFAFLFLPE